MQSLANDFTRLFATPGGSLGDGKGGSGNISKKNNVQSIGIQPTALRQLLYFEA